MLWNEWINNEENVEKIREITLWTECRSIVSSMHKEFRHKTLHASTTRPHTIYTDLNSSEL